MKPERLRVILLVTAAAVIGFNVWMYVTWPEAPSLTCGNTESARTPSPDGRQHAVLFTRACGTETAGPQISILAAGTVLPDEAGNAFAADGGKVTAIWTAPAALTVTHAPGAVISRSEAQVAGTAISYRAE